MTVSRSVVEVLPTSDEREKHGRTDTHHAGPPSLGKLEASLVEGTIEKQKGWKISVGQV